MTVVSKLCFCFLIVHITLSGCGDKDSNNTKITIDSKTQANAAVRLFYNSNFDEKTLLETKTDSAGYSAFELTLQKPMFVIIKIGEKFGELYLSPGDNLHIKENGADYKIPLSFSGKGSGINNYVSWVNSNVEKIKWAGGRGLYGLKPDEFFSRFDSLKHTINSFHNGYMDSVALSTEAAAMLEYKNSIKFASVEQEYKCYRFINFINEKREAYRSGKGFPEDKLAREHERITDEIPFDPALLTDGYADYQTLLNYYWHNTINLPVADDLIAKDSGNLAPIKTDALIKKGDYPEALREALASFNLLYWLGAFGIAPETDAVFASFKRSYPESAYLPAINRRYNEWLALSPGKPAPDFIGYTPEGQKVSLKDLKGKIVYIDVWATWCAPCIAEIPASKNLQREFENNRDVQFLSVSIDTDKSDWVKFLKADPAWKGLHVVIEKDRIQSFHSSYKLSGVPEYILIDRSGNIVNIKAPRPSDEKAREEIKKLLAAGY